MSLVHPYFMGFSLRKFKKFANEDYRFFASEKRILVRIHRLGSKFFMSIYESNDRVGKSNEMESGFTCQALEEIMNNKV